MPIAPIPIPMVAAIIFYDLAGIERTMQVGYHRPKFDAGSQLSFGALTPFILSWRGSHDPSESVIPRRNIARVHKRSAGTAGNRALLTGDWGLGTGDRGPATARRRLMANPRI